MILTAIPGGADKLGADSSVASNRPHPETVQLARTESLGPPPRLHQLTNGVGAKVKRDDDTDVDSHIHNRLATTSSDASVEVEFGFGSKAQRQPC